MHVSRAFFLTGQTNKTLTSASTRCKAFEFRELKGKKSGAKFKKYTPRFKVFRNKDGKGINECVCLPIPDVNFKLTVL